MYHCHIQFYFVGKSCRVFECIKTLQPQEHFTHAFSKSSQPEQTLTAKADVIVVNLQDADEKQLLRTLIREKSEKAELFVLAEKEQIMLLADVLPEIKDIWVWPMSDEEISFRLLRWQQTYKMSKDYWQTSHYLEATINNVPNLIWYKDKNGIHEKVNDSFCKTVNKTKKQVEGRGHAYIWDVEQDDPACIESEHKVMTRKETFTSEEIIRAGEGMRTLMTYKSPLYDLDGSVMGTVGVAIDVTQERAYEQEIMQKKRTLETLFTTMDCGIMCHTMDGSRIISINRAALEILGYDSQEEMMLDGFDMIAASVAEEDKEKLRACIQKLKKEGDTVNLEYCVNNKSGEIRHVMGNIKLIKENGELLCQRFLLDCTAQKLKEKEKERQQAELIYALSIDYNFVYFLDLNTGYGTQLRLDEENECLFGNIFNEELLFEENMERYINIFVCDEDKDQLKQAVSCDWMRKELSERKQCHVNYRTEKDGEMRYFQMKLVRTGVWDETGRGVVLGFRSVDEEIRNEMEQKSLLEDALFEANRASQAKSVFLSNMSHDIRTPMNAIVGFTALAISHIDQKERVETYLEKIKTSGNHLLSLINDVLDMSRIESGKMRLQEQCCNLPELLNGLQNIVQADVHAKHQQLSVDASNIRNQEVYCDKLRLNQVLLNLVGNAVKYTEEGGSISLKVTERTGAAKGCASYDFCVRDTGIGMSETFVAHIFEPFEREKNTTISGIQGTGLGMSITKSIVEMMDGSIEVKSKQGVGSEFTVSFTFQLVAGPESLADPNSLYFDIIEKKVLQEDEQEEDTKQAEAGQRRILLTEDNELNQEIAVEILSGAGFYTEVAENGKVAVDMLRRSKPGYYQLVLMDIQMPVMNGYEATRAIRALEDQELSSIPILAMTANAFEEDRQKALMSGMNGHIAKPIDIDRLLDTLGQILK